MSGPVIINLLWQSERDFHEFSRKFQDKEYVIVSNQTPPDLRIFDASGYSDFEAAQLEFTTINVPSLVVSKDQDEEQWLEFISLNDSVCRISDFEKMFSLHVIRNVIRKKEWSQIFRRSIMDSLTGLLPRNELMRRIDIELTIAEPDTPLALLLIDLDHFKRINDLFGHTAGDAVLRSVSRIIRDCIKKDDAAYRFGGEEFAVIVRMNLTQAQALAEFIRKEISLYDYSSIAPELKLTASIGVAVNSNNDERELFIHDADIALYSAKAEGRNRVCTSERNGPFQDIEPGEAAITDFENRIRVLTERLTSVLSAKSRQIISHLQQEADFDGLTGLYNRRYFDRRIAREFERIRPDGGMLSLIFIDIDHFGQVNKTYGFPTGDMALQEVSRVLKSSIRSVDWPARYGGEELCVVLPGTDETAACEVAERIWRAARTATLTAYDGRSFHLTISVGVAELCSDDRILLDFIQRTSDRTRYAKEHGRDQICCCDRAPGRGL